jgi:hypothetical protein
MNREKLANRLAHVFVIAALILVVTVGSLGAWGVTNFGSVHLADTNGTATPVFMVNSTGPSAIAEFRDGGTPVARILDGGSLEMGAGFDLNGQALTIDADGDTSLQASLDDIVTTTLGAATGRLDIATGNFQVGDGSPDTTLNGEDAYVEGTFEVDGAVNFDGAVDIDGNLTSATGAVTVADTLNATGAVDFDSTLNVDGATTAVTITMSSDFISGAQSTFVVEYGIPITPTGLYQPITSATSTAAESACPIAAPNDDTIGKQLILHNINASQVITIDGTGATVECKADVALGAGDTLILLWNGDDWNCLSSYDNS